MLSTVILGVRRTKTDTFNHFLRLKPMILTIEYCSNIDHYLKKVFNLVTLDSKTKTVSGFRPD